LPNANVTTMFRWHLSTKTEIRFFPLKLRFESDPSPLLLIQFRISRTKVLPLLGQSSLKPAKGIRKQLLGCSFQLRAKAYRHESRKSRSATPGSLVGANSVGANLKDGVHSSAQTSNLTSEPGCMQRASFLEHPAIRSVGLLPKRRAPILPVGKEPRSGNSRSAGRGSSQSPKGGLTHEVCCCGSRNVGFSGNTRVS
jgi:hypothetical protein